MDANIAANAVMELLTKARNIFKASSWLPTAAPPQVQCETSSPHRDYLLSLLNCSDNNDEIGCQHPSFKPESHPRESTPPPAVRHSMAGVHLMGATDIPSTLPTRDGYTQTFWSARPPTTIPDTEVIWRDTPCNGVQDYLSPFTIPAACSCSQPMPGEYPVSATPADDIPSVWQTNWCQDTYLLRATSDRPSVLGPRLPLPDGQDLILLASSTVRPGTPAVPRAGALQLAYNYLDREQPIFKGFYPSPPTPEDPVFRPSIDRRHFVQPIGAGRPPAAKKLGPTAPRTLATAHAVQYNRASPPTRVTPTSSTITGGFFAGMLPEVRRVTVAPIVFGLLKSIIDDLDNAGNTNFNDSEPRQICTVVEMSVDAQYLGPFGFCCALPLDKHETELFGSMLTLAEARSLNNEVAGIRRILNPFMDIDESEIDRKSLQI